MMSACSQLEKQPEFQRYWPAAPELPRVVYETTLRDADSLIEKDRSQILQEIATGSATGNRQTLIKPYDIAASAGIVVVSDSMSSIVHVFDISRKRLFAIGWRGEGRLVKPLGVAMDQQQNIYVVDAALGKIVKFDKRGHFLTTIGDAKDFSRISDVAVSRKNGKVFVVDRGGVESNNHRVVIYSAKGEKLNIIGRRGHGPGEFNHPTQIAIDNNDQVYVLDAGNFRVQIFSAKGEYHSHWGRLGNKLGNFARPRGIAVNENAYVFVTDAAFQNFQIFNQQGQLLLNIGAGGGPDVPGQYMLPSGVAVDETNRIYVVDQIRRKVDVFRLLSESEIQRLNKKESD